ncbi:uncharacterized protein LOC134255012 [Saccostrea cucullata]|uniref:uncharacterized protein LOC134255012 n=1 Tax=Saccostrea cuccullata TaxID=36930 RepID=UPI002ED26481
MFRQTGSRSEPYSPPTPPGTPQKDRKHSSLVDKQEHQRHTGLLIPPSSQTKRLSPLQIDTSYGNAPIPLESRCGSIGEGQQTDYQNNPPPSPGFFIPTTTELTDQQKGYIWNIVHQLSYENASQQSYTETSVSGAQPFPLQDPSNFRLKRQISTESSDSADIKFSNKGPTKRPTISQTRHPSQAEEKGDGISQKQADLEPLNLCSPCKSKISPKPYTATLQWVLNPEDPNPNSEEDFIPASKVIQDQKPKENVTMSTSTPKTVNTVNERTASFSSKDFHQEMMGGFKGRGGEPYNTGTTTAKSSNLMVTERGFVFPSVPSVSDPIPFSPRIVGNNHPFQSRNKDVDKNVLDYMKSSSLDDVSSDSVFGSGASPPDYKQKSLGTYLRHKALRSFSDIEHSPSKSETEEIQEILREYKRCVSDPTFTPPSQKAMLREERLVHGIFPPNMSSEESPPDSFDHVTDQARINAELRRMNSFMKGQLELMRKQQAKRQLFSPHSSASEGSRCGHASLPQENPEEFARWIIDELRTMSSSRYQTYDTGTDRGRAQYGDRVDGCATTGCNSAYCKHRQEKSPVQQFLPPPASPRQRQPSPSSRMPAPSSSPCLATASGQSSSPWAQSSPRKRKRDQVEMRITCEAIAEESDHVTEMLQSLEHAPGRNCKCASVEQEILQMAVDAYAKIRRGDDTPNSFQRFQGELCQTNNRILEAMKILSAIKTICKHGRTIEHIYPGSVVFVISCPSVTSLDALWRMYVTGDLSRLMNDSFLTESVRIKHNAYDVILRVDIPKEQYLRCRKKLAESVLDSSFSKSDTEIMSIGSSSKENVSSPYRRKTMKNLAVVHMRSSSEPTQHVHSPSNSPGNACSPFSPRDRKFSYPVSGEKSPRRAFQEIQFPSSPTLRRVFNFDLSLTPTTSPKRKSFAEVPPWENESESENQTLSSPKRFNKGQNMFFR